MVHFQFTIIGDSQPISGFHPQEKREGGKDGGRKLSGGQRTWDLIMIAEVYFVCIICYACHLAYVLTCFF